MTAMLQQLEKMLSVVTGFHSCSLQPNSGAAGEYAGLLTIHRYQVAQGQGHRNVCLIPNPLLVFFLAPHQVPSVVRCAAI